MKLFSEYYSGQVNYDFHLFGQDDIDFLEQFPSIHLEDAIVQRYCFDLPQALLMRDEARKKPLENLLDERGKKIKKNYYELLDERGDAIFKNLVSKSDTPDEKQRIKLMSYYRAKNALDKMLDERSDNGGKWMNVDYPRKNYQFIKFHNYYNQQKRLFLSLIN